MTDKPKFKLFSGRLPVYVGIFVVLFFGLVLRFVNLEKRGFLQYDEAYYALEARTIPVALHWVKNNWSSLSQNTISLSVLKSELKNTGCLFPLSVGKPFYLALLSASFTFFGQTDFADLGLSAFFGLLVLLLGYLLASKIFGERAGIAGGLVLFASVLNLHYSRSGYPQTLATAMLLLTMYLLSMRRFYPSGIALALSFTSHYCILFNIFAVLLWLLIFEKKNILKFLIGFLSVILFIELVYGIIGIALGKYLKDVNFMTYIQQVMRQFFWANEGTKHLFSRDPLWAVKLLVKPEGVPMFFTALISFAVLMFKARNLSANAWLLIFNGWLVFFIWVVSPGYVAPRALFPAWTVILIAVTFFLSKLSSSARNVILSCLVVFALFRFYPMVNITSAYKEASLWINADGNSGVCDLFNWPIYQFYTGKKIYANVDTIRTAEDLANAESSGVKYFTIDHTAMLSDVKAYPFIQTISETVVPVKKYDLVNLRLPWLETNFMPYKYEYELFQKKGDEKYEIRIFEIESITRAILSRFRPGTATKSRE